jgi:hypothetical protein
MATEDNVKTEYAICLMCGEWRGDQVVHSCKPRKLKATTKLPPTPNTGTDR